MSGSTETTDPVSEERIAAWARRFITYRSPVTEETISVWLKRFGQEHLDLAARVLDGVEFYEDPTIEGAFRHLLDGLPGWHKDAPKRQGRWRFVGLGNAAKSGGEMVGKLRVAAGLTWPQFEPMFPHLRDLPGEQLGPDDSVVFVDDFSGSGTQAIGWWPQVQELLTEGPTVYLLLVAATSHAVNEIAKKTAWEVRVHQTFGLDKNVFAAECQSFSEADKAALHAYCAAIDKKCPMGYGECGLLLVFRRRTPNNSIPLLHGRGGLFPRDATHAQ